MSEDSSTERIIEKNSKSAARVDTAPIAGIIDIVHLRESKKLSSHILDLRMILLRH